ncbi:hypothetical protein [Microcystis aeruginosa]|nr:hypothetical protein [Microcystis aeruginosa]
MLFSVLPKARRSRPVNSNQLSVGKWEVGKWGSKVSSGTLP